jgi:ketosteroid isomerase-like protein
MRQSPTAVAPTFALAWMVGGCGGAQPAPLAPVASAASAPAAAPSGSASGAGATVAPVPSVVEAAPPPPGRPALAELVEKTLSGARDAFNAHDAKRVASYYTDDCAASSFGSYDGSGSAASGEVPARGRDEVAAGLERMFAAFGDVKSATLRGWVSGHVVVSEIAWSGTMTGDFMGLKASHRPVGLVALRVMRVDDDGLVSQAHEYADTAGLVAQMEGKKSAPAAPILPSNTLDLHVAKGTPEEDQLAVWARGLDETFGKDDAKAVLAEMADDGDYWTNLGGPALKGKRDLEKGLTAWFKAFPDQKWTSTEAWGIDGFAIIEHSMSGTQKGPLGTLAASRKAVSDWHWVDILQPTADRTVLHGWGFTNVTEMTKQTGALKQPVQQATTATTKAAPAATPSQPKGSVAPAPKKKK